MDRPTAYKVRMLVHPARAHPLHATAPRPGPVVYWMSRDQRAEDNWALLWAANRAENTGAPLFVVFCLDPAFPDASRRHFAFMLAGLAETEATLRRHGIPLILLCGDPATTLPAFLDEQKAGCCVTDFDPMRIKRQWQQAVTERFAGPFLEVDAHNVVPCRLASDKREYAAATLRPKLHRLLPEFLEPFPKLPVQPDVNLTGLPAVDWPAVQAVIRAEVFGPLLEEPRPGAAAAKACLKRFLRERLSRYAEARNDPNAAATSELSPYLHFGQIAPQRVALEVMKAQKEAPDSVTAFLEELVVRRELTDNFCHYEPDYDRFEALPAWARQTLLAHADDVRAYRYDRTAFETAATHSDLWNATQRQLVRTGRIHGYLRMYWAKKILEWSATPRQALETALALNDRYALDGRDPNGVVGVAWAIGGLHDRAWANRPIFGQIRFMNERGCRRKFDVDAYIARFGETPT